MVFVQKDPETVRRLQELLKKCPLSQRVIGNICTYSCPVCHETFKAINSIVFHLVSKHGKEKISVHQAAVRYGSILKAHRCFICGETILCDRLYLGHHLRQKHKITAQEYSLKFRCALPSLYTRSSKKWREILSTSERTNELENLCVYRCNICREKRNSWAEMKRHLRGHPQRNKSNKHIAKINGRSRNDNAIEESGNLNNVPKLGATDYLEKAVIFECLLCQARMLCDKIFVHKHLYTHHGSMGLGAYAQKFNLKYVNFGNPLNVVTQETDTTSSEGEVTLVAMSCHRWTNVWLHKKLLKSRISQELIGNLSHFECLLCSAKFDSTGALSKHAKSRHGTLVDKRVMYEECAKELVAHKCRLCDKLIMCEKRHIRGHIKVHNLASIQEYCALTGCRFQSRSSDGFSRLQRLERPKKTKKPEVTDGGKKEKVAPDSYPGLNLECRVILHDILDSSSDEE